MKTKTLLVFGAKYILESFVYVETFLFFFFKVKVERVWNRESCTLVLPLITFSDMQGTRDRFGSFHIETG